MTAGELLSSCHPFFILFLILPVTRILPESDGQTNSYSHGIRFFDDWIPDLKAAYGLRPIGE